VTALAELFANADDWVLERVQEFDPRPRLAHLTLESAARLLVLVRAAKAALAVGEGDLQRHVAELMGNKQVEVPGLGVLVKHYAGSRKGWDHESCRRAVVARLADELPYAGAVDANGERVPTAAMVSGVLDEWAKVCGYQWKVTGLRDLGLDPDLYSEFTPKPDATPSVEVQ
jgi:hypothetical protein